MFLRPIHTNTLSAIAMKMKTHMESPIQMVPQSNKTIIVIQCIYIYICIYMCFCFASVVQVMAQVRINSMVSINFRISKMVPVKLRINRMASVHLRINRRVSINLGGAVKPRNL